MFDYYGILLVDLNLNSNLIVKRNELSAKIEKQLVFWDF